MDASEQLYERVLVLRSQAGDAAAFAELVERYGPRLRYYLRKMVRDADAADDLLQDVWLDVFRGLRRLADPAALAAWLYRIARARAARHWRRGRPDEVSFLAESAPEVEDDRDFSAEDAEHVHAALDRIASEQREVLVLRFLEGMTYEDIAGVVGCQVGTVRSRIHYGKRALRRLLEDVRL